MFSAMMVLKTHVKHILHRWTHTLRKIKSHSDTVEAFCILLSRKEGLFLFIAVQFKRKTAENCFLYCPPAPKKIES